VVCVFDTVGKYCGGVKIFHNMKMNVVVLIIRMVILMIFVMPYFSESAESALVSNYQWCVVLVAIYFVGNGLMTSSLNC
jgi:hypothetical protein